MPPDQEALEAASIANARTSALWLENDWPAIEHNARAAVKTAEGRLRMIANMLNVVATEYRDAQQHLHSMQKAAYDHERLAGTPNLHAPSIRWPNRTPMPPSIRPREVLIALAQQLPDLVGEE